MICFFWGEDHVYVKSLDMSIVINIQSILRTKEVTRKLQQHLPLLHQRFQVLKCWCYLYLQYLEHIATPISWVNISFTAGIYTFSMVVRVPYLTIEKRLVSHLSLNTCGTTMPPPCPHRPLEFACLGVPSFPVAQWHKGWVFFWRWSRDP